MEVTTSNYSDLIDRSQDNRVTVPRRKLRNGNTFLAAVMVIVLLFTLAVVGLHAYLAWTLARPYIMPIESNPLEAIGLDYEDVQFYAEGASTPLQGWYLPAANISNTTDVNDSRYGTYETYGTSTSNSYTSTQSKSTVIFSHGYGTNREEYWVPMYDLVKAVHNQNFNILMFDYGYVNTNMNVTGGVRETKELLSAVEFAKHQGAEDVYIWGFSMGAGIALQAALHSNNDIKGMILDSTFLLEPDTLYYNLSQHLPLPRFPSVLLMQLMFPLLNGVHMGQIPYSEIRMKQYDVPILMIHGKQDDKAPYEIALSISENQISNKNSALWLLPNGKHELIFRVWPKEYLERSFSFMAGL